MTSSSFSFGILEHGLARYFEVLPEDTARFRARIKQLQRLEFPSGVNVGRGVKMPYNNEHLLKLVLAFELIDNGMTAKPATKLVENQWARFRAGLGAVAMADPKSSYVYADIYPNVLSDSTGKSATVLIEDESSRKNSLQLTRWGRVSFLSVCLTSLFARLVKQTEESRRLGNYFMYLELREWFDEEIEFDALTEGRDWYRLGQFNEQGKLKIFDHGNT
ncbi:MAG: hypothetical protein ABGW84_08125 [Sphingomonadaceae bacterium]